jgi:small-conductance mechanosensitive channel
MVQEHESKCWVWMILGNRKFTIKFRIKTLPSKQFEVARELRRRIKNRFDELGIEIPFPHRTLYWGSDKRQFPDIKAS